MPKKSGKYEVGSTSKDYLYFALQSSYFVLLNTFDLMSKKAMLIIMDGWGLGKVPSSDAIQHAKVPFVTSLFDKYPNTTLVTCGEDVGLPAGQMGNSEVGHLNLGAGRIVYQELQRLNVAIKDGSFTNNPALLDTIKYCKENNKPLHLMGLVSDGGVHSHINHLKALTTICKEHGLSEVYIQAFTDGRDTDPKSGLGFINDLESHLKKTTGKIASIVGRYYAMDRDKRWERVKIAYDALVNRQGEISNDLPASLKASYEANVTDEFLKPIINSATPDGAIKAGDAVICFNFRTDRCREITLALTQEEIPGSGMTALPLHYTTMTMYDHTFKNIEVMFEKDDLKNTIGEVLSNNGKKADPDCRNRKISSCHIFLQRGARVSFPGGEQDLHPFSQGCHIRPPAGNERYCCYRCITT